MNWLDRLFPGWALKREQQLKALNMVRQYDGATRGRRTAGWRTSSTSANAETEAAIQTLRDRSRDLVRNNPWANKAIQVIEANVVGHGITPAVSHPNRRITPRASDEFTQWFYSTKADAEGTHDIPGLTALVMRTVAESGACIVRREIDPNAPFPLRLRVMEPDHLDTSRDFWPTGQQGSRTYRGMEFNERGEVIAYWLYPDHPGDRFNRNLRGQSSVRVPADQVAYVFRKDRPGQLDGVPWAAPVLVRLRDIEDATDARLMQQKIAACFAAFVVDPQADPGTPKTADNDYAVDHIEPGIIEQMPLGRDIKFAQPPAVTGWAEYMGFELHAVAAGFGITYESLTGMLDSVNFSSGRMGWIEMSRNIDNWRWKMLVPQFLERVWEWYTWAAPMAGRDVDRLTIEWTPPRRELIDPTKEIPAIIKSIRGGLMTLSEAQRMFGYDPVRMLKEYATDNKLLDELGVVLDSDPRQRDQAGKPLDSGDDPLDEAMRTLIHARAEQE